MGKNAQRRRLQKAESYQPGIHSQFMPRIIDRRLLNQGTIELVRQNYPPPRVFRGRRYPLIWAWGYLNGVPEDRIQSAVDIAIDQGFPSSTVSVLELKHVLKVAGATGYLPLQIQNIHHRGVRQFLQAKAGQLG